MDTPTVSNTSEGIYIGLVSPDQDVHSTVGQTSHNSPGAQHTETSGQSSHPYRLAGGCVVLCALLLTPAIVLGVLYTSASQNYSMGCVEEPIRANNSTLDKDQLQRDYNSLNTQKDQLQRDYNSLNTQKDQLQRDYDSLNTQKDQLQRDYDSLNTQKDQLQRDYDSLNTQKDQLQRDNDSLNTQKDQLQRDYDSLNTQKDQLQRDYDSLNTQKDQLQRDNDSLITQKDQLQRDYDSLNTQKDQLQRDYNSLNTQKDQLQRDFDAVVVKFPVLDQYCPLRSQKRVCKPCPEGWEQRNSTCYYFSTERKSWNDSRSACLKQGADLVIIESKEEQDFIYKHTGGGDVYWIGLSDSETEGTWLWVDGTPLQEDKAFWRRREPDDFGSEDCAAAARGWVWGDVELGDGWGDALPL
ncbi:hypothetical protein AAFF_G00266650 [Aldrovandia affinis]|uniref:C-type lectin domain-containing protein n=1 Tax=Aldrovandia affinis TaxID=143900 RepID=A0AAD7W2Z0_9TELE|nr:hypothetical protein AAFF_G00266650 [Aldrovandia affinis]